MAGTVGVEPTFLGLQPSARPMSDIPMVSIEGLEPPVSWFVAKRFVH